MTTAASGEESGSVLELGEPFVRWSAGEVRAHAARRGVRQAELARRLGVSQQWVSTRMSARVPMTTADLARIARVLDMTPMELLSGESRPPGPGQPGPDAPGGATTRKYLGTSGPWITPSAEVTRLDLARPRSPKAA